MRSAACSARRMQDSALVPSPRCAYALACIAYRSEASAGVMCLPAARSAASAKATACRYSRMNSDWLTSSAMTYAPSPRSPLAFASRSAWWK